MEFLRLRLGAFGMLRDLDTGPEPLTRLVVVLGPNEAGKSTLFAFLTSILYGIYPASRDRNPYTPWAGGDIDGRAVLKMGDGEVWDVHRRLLSSPSGTLTRGTKGEEIRNLTLPCAEHVPRAVFRQVFALTLGELAALEGESWSRVQDRLVAGMGAADLAPVRSLVEELEREAGRLWRPNRMGNQKVRDLRERLRELRLRRRAASEADGRLRDLAREKAALAAELREARREREACHLYVERCQTLLPSRERLRRIDELEARAGPEEELAGLPVDPTSRLEELERAVEAREARLAGLRADAEEPRRRIEAFGTLERTVLDRARDIRELVARSAGLEPVRVRTGQLEQELRDLERRSEDTARELFPIPWDEVDRDGVLSVPAARLRRALDACREAREDRRIAEEAARRIDSVEGARPLTAPGVGVGLTVLGGGILAVALATGRPLLGVPASLLLGVGVALLAVGRLGSRRRPHDVASPGTTRLDGARAAEAETRAAVVELLSSLPVREELLERPPAELAGSVERLQELVRDRRDRLAELEGHRHELESVAAAVSRLAADLEVEVPPDPTVAAHRLEVRLREAETAREAAASARREVARLEREMEAVSTEMAHLRERRDALADRLAALARPAEDGLWATRAVEERLEARETARRLRAELRREHPDLEELRRRIDRLEASGADWHLDADTLAHRRAREAELGDRIEKLGRRVEGIEKDMDYLRREETVGAVDGEIEAVQAELESEVRVRDRLHLLAAVVREADRRFRAEHQPDILRKAGCHLATITGDRYERILLDEAGEGRFLLDGPGYPGPVEVDRPVSTGTREQVYLALRLAILDHLDRHGERLPLFMDEAFVNWDEARRERGFGLLEDMARTRQVFVFTCHESMAGSLAARGARVLVLEGAT